MAHRRDSVSDPHSPSDGRYTEIRSFLRDLDALVARDPDSPEMVLSVKQRLSDLIATCPDLPEQVTSGDATHYARHLLYGEPEGRYEVVVMAWSPGQSTPVHDHAGIWCVEGVVRGVVDVTRYDLTEMLGEETARMEPLEVIKAGLGQCGALIPPVEYHKIANPYDRLALTMHVYGGRMRACRVFEERGDSTYRVVSRPLEFTSPKAALARV